MTAKPFTLLTAALLGFVLSAPAQAGPSHGRGIGPIHHPGLARGHKDHDCLYRCRHLARVCFSAAREDVHMCVETICS